MLIYNQDHEGNDRELVGGATTDSQYHTDGKGDTMETVACKMERSEGEALDERVQIITIVSSVSPRTQGFSQEGKDFNSHRAGG